MAFTKEVVAKMLEKLKTEQAGIATQKETLITNIREKRHEINSAKVELAKLDVAEAEINAQIELVEEVATFDDDEENSPFE